MARKKAADNSAAINFRCSVQLKASVEDLARLSRQDVSSLLVSMCVKFVEVNKQRIANFRRQAAQPIKMPFDNAQKKTAHKSTPIIADETANNAPLVDAAQDDDKGGDSV